MLLLIAWPRSSIAKPMGNIVRPETNARPLRSVRGQEKVFCENKKEEISRLEMQTLIMLPSMRCQEMQKRWSVYYLLAVMGLKGCAHTFDCLVVCQVMICQQLSVVLLTSLQVQQHQTNMRQYNTPGILPSAP